MHWGTRTVLVGALAVAHVAPVAAEEAPIPHEPATETQHVKLVPTNERLVITYRWPRWVPWTVLGGAIGLGGLGALVQFSADDMMNQYDQRVASSCAISGCNLESPQTPAEHQLADELNAMRESAERRDKVALVMLVGAGATLVTGVMLLVLNRPERHVLKLDLVPATGGATAIVGWRF